MKENQGYLDLARISNAFKVIGQKQLRNQQFITQVDQQKRAREATGQLLGEWAGAVQNLSNDPVKLIDANRAFKQKAMMIPNGEKIVGLIDSDTNDAISAYKIKEGKKPTNSDWITVIDPVTKQPESKTVGNNINYHYKKLDSNGNVVGDQWRTAGKIPAPKEPKQNINPNMTDEMYRFYEGRINKATSEAYQSGQQMIMLDKGFFTQPDPNDPSKTITVKADPNEIPNLKQKFQERIDVLNKQIEEDNKKIGGTWKATISKPKAPYLKNAR